jgi:hypothetical protein
LNLRKVKDAGTITMGNGTHKTITEIADVVAIICNENGSKRVRVQNVTIFRNGQFNLFSMSQMLKKVNIFQRHSLIIEMMVSSI